MYAYLQKGAVLVAAFGLSFSLRAQPLAEEDAVVVTASRSEQRVRDAIPHVTILTRREILESGALDVPTLLRREAGFEFSQNGGLGKTSSTFLRGAATNQVLVLVDGVRVSSLTTGATQLDQLMLDHIERIEIVRGGASSLYGSGAIGGVIQIFTREGRGEPRASLEAGAGGEGTHRLRAFYGGEVGATRFSVGLSHIATDGFSAIDPAVAPAANPDRDGYRNLSFSASLAHRFAAGHEAGLRLHSSEGRVEFDSAFGPPSATHNGATRVGALTLYLQNRIGERWLSRLSLNEGRDLFASYTNGALASRTRTANAQFSWLNDIALADEQMLRLGYERLGQSVASTTAYGRTGRKVEALLAGWRGRLGAHALQLDLRSEDYSDFGRARSHYLGWGYDWTGELRLVAALARSFRAPTFNELFFPGFGNPLLRPERVRHAEAGLQYAAGPHLARAMLFRARVTDLINPFPVVNIDQATLEGVELSWRGAVAGFDLRASLTFQDPVENRPGIDRRLLRRAKRYGSLELSRSAGPLRVSAEVLAAGAREDNHITAFPTRRIALGGYGIVNLAARLRAGPQSELHARLDNVFDRRYELAHGYNVQGRRLLLALRYGF